MIVLVTPVFNDWASFDVLVGELDAVARTLPEPLAIVAVDDGSTQPRPELRAAPAHLASIEVVQLHANVGHQRAIAIGLSRAVAREDVSAVAVMDCDGEDSPAELSRLFAALQGSPESIVVAARTKRSESAGFRMFYWFYRHLFRLFTGERIRFGNFCLLPIRQARRVAYMGECWNHLAGAIVRSRVPVVPVATARGHRYAGRTHMNMVSLVVHGFSAMSVFSDRVLTRMLMILGLVAAVAAGSALATVIVRLFTDLAIPGWATTAFGMSALIFLQAVTLLTVMVFITLNNRSNLSFIPALHYSSFVAGVVTLHPRPR